MTAWGWTTAAYVLLVLAAVGTDVLGRVRPDVVPSLGVALRRAVLRRSTALALVVVWWWLGWHFVTGD